MHTQTHTFSQGAYCIIFGAQQMGFKDEEETFFHSVTLSEVVPI